MSQPLHAESRRTDGVYSILADAERRAVLRILAAVDAPTEVGDLAGRVADLADGQPRPERCRIGLQHRHLPKMADATVVDYDPAGGRVALTPTGRRALEVLACGASRLRPERR